MSQNLTPGTPTITGSALGAPADSSAGAPVSIRDRIIEALAMVRATSRQELEHEIHAAGGDLEIDSPQAEAAIGRLKHQLGVNLPGPKDLEPEQCNSITALTDLVERELDRPVRTGRR
jgi:acyl carrier protein